MTAHAENMHLLEEQTKKQARIHLTEKQWHPLPLGHAPNSLTVKAIPPQGSNEQLYNKNKDQSLCCSQGTQASQCFHRSRE